MKRNIGIIFVLSLLMLSTIQLISDNNTGSATLTGYSEYNGQNGFIYIYPVVTWTLARNTSIGSTILQNYIYGRSLYNGNYGNYRGFMFFNTSSIPDTAIITKVNLSCYIDIVSNTPGVAIISDSATAHAPGISLETSDYDISLYDTVLYNSDTLTSGYKNFTLSNTNTFINLTGVSRCMFTNNKCDWLKKAPTVNSVQIYLENESLVKLWIIYTMPEPPLSPTRLVTITTNTIHDCSSMKIGVNWTKSLGADKTVIFIDTSDYTGRSGDEVYNNTGNSLLLPVGDEGGYTYFSVYSWNNTYRWFSNIPTYDLCYNGDMIERVNELNLTNCTGYYNSECYYDEMNFEYVKAVNFTAKGNSTLFDEDEYILPIVTTFSLMGVGFLMIRRRKKNES